MEIPKITGDHFQTEVTGAGRPVLLEFYRQGCAACEAQLPILEQAADEACDVKFCRVDAGEEPELAAAYGVTDVPAMFIVSGEEIFRSFTGGRGLETVLEYLEM